jgi:hypothetical protein
MVARVRTKVRGTASTAAEAAVVVVVAAGAEEAVARTTGAVAVRGPIGTIALP